MMSNDPEKFAQEIRKTLIRHADAVNTLSDRGMFFGTMVAPSCWKRPELADVLKPNGNFRYPSYVEDIMGPICFDYGFGPYRWVCTQPALRTS